MNKACFLFLLALATALPAGAAPSPLSPALRIIPGHVATPTLSYQNPTARTVQVTGTWNLWATRSPMALSNGVWVIDTRTLPAGEGRHEFKFIVNGEWETGANRVLYMNATRQLETPDGQVLEASLFGTNDIRVYVRDRVPDPAAIQARLSPPIAIQEQFIAQPPEPAVRRGYALHGARITFLFDEKLYGLDLRPDEQVAVAGSFTGWGADGGNRGQWLLSDDDDDGVWQMTTQLDGLQTVPGQHEHLFRFVANGETWTQVPQAGNAREDGKGNRNLVVETNVSGCAVLKFITATSVPLTQNHTITLSGLSSRKAVRLIDGGCALDSILSTKPLGATLDKAQNATTYRIFAPRATNAYLCLFNTPDYETREPPRHRLTPSERFPMWMDPADGVWEISLLGLDAGKYYSFNVEGPAGAGEEFSPLSQIGDPYALAAAHSHNNTIVIDPEATNKWFSGWTDQDWRTPKHEDMVIYELHLRDATIHPSAKVPPQYRSTYPGLAMTANLDTGLGHLKNMGFNMIELLPVSEFENGVREYGWGYATVFYFSPEASYATAPLKGSQYYEFKSLVNTLHRQGFGVILDVVYNHVAGQPNVFQMTDKKYYFRLNPDYSHNNFSGCGNDIRSEAPMMRRLIVDNIVYWMKEHHVDGFRFDLGELIDMETMLAVRDAARAINPDVILISEPWSFRGVNKHQLKGTGWAAWNNDYRYAAKDFARGRVDREWLRKNMLGSVDIWTANPMQSINYIESHDDMALADEFCLRPDKNGKYLDAYDVAMNKLAATVLFTSLGIPMVNEGQEFLRSKYGVHNSFDKGDAVNAIRWSDRERPLAGDAMNFYRGLIQLRQSPQGQAFRVREAAPSDYYKWLMPGNERKAVGYLVNSPRVHAGHGFIVLANASDQDYTFSFKIPEGQWKLIGDGNAINLSGLPGQDALPGGQQASIIVPRLSSYILMDGF